MKKISEMAGRYDCTYCGMHATCLDHVVPFSYNHDSNRTTHSSYSKQECVPACKECNGLLSNLMYITVAERALFLVGRLMEKHRQLLGSPDWTPEEFEELSGSLLKHVKSLQTKKKILKARIEYAKAVSQMTDLTAINVWDSQQLGADGSSVEV